MGAIFKAQLLNLKRNPWAVLIMVVLTVAMSAVFGFQATSVIRVQVVPAAGLSEGEIEHRLELLNESQTFEFVVGEEEQLLADLAASNSGLGLRLGPDYGWTVLASQGETNAPVLAAFVEGVFRQELVLQAAARSLPNASVDELRADLEAELQRPALRVQVSSVEAESDFEYNPRVHTLLGFGLFFASFTIMFGVNNILEERRIGIWDRVIYSPATRLSMYAGHLGYSFLLGFLQITAIFLVFKYVFDVPLGDNLTGLLLVIAAYTFAIVALALLLAGLVGNSQRMNVIIPIVCVSSAMLGGAYWPLEIVRNEFLLTASNFVPIRHAMDALKGIAYYSYTLQDLLLPLAIMMLFGVVCLAIGLRLVERR